MNFPYSIFHLEAQRAKRNLLHVFEAEPDVPVADSVLPAAKCSSAQARKRKTDSRMNPSELGLDLENALRKIGPSAPMFQGILHFIRSFESIEAQRKTAASYLPVPSQSCWPISKASTRKLVPVTVSTKTEMLKYRPR
jgi:hypothetical protein